MTTPHGMRDAVGMGTWSREELQQAHDNYLATHNGLLILNFDEGSTPSSPAEVAAAPTDFVCPTCASLGAGARP